MAQAPGAFQPLTRRTARRIISAQEYAPLRALFDEVGPRLTTLVAAHFSGFERALLTRNPENYGLYFVHARARVPFLWLGVAWAEGDPEGTLPSWGLSLEVDGAEVRQLAENVGGLLAACQAVDARQESVQLHRFPKHLELATWRPFDWLLAEEDQPAAVIEFWEQYLEILVAGGLPAAVAAFIQAT